MKPEDEKLDVQQIRSVKVERGKDGAGREMYRHVIVTEWHPIPHT